MALAALNGIKNDSKTGFLGGFTLQTNKMTQTTVSEEKPVVDEPVTSSNAIMSKEEIKLVISSLCSKYGLNYEQFYNTIDGESSFLVDPPHNNDSRGIAQYTLDTWLGNCSKTDERLDAVKSLNCMAIMWSKGQQYRWDAYCLRYLDEKCVKLRGIYPDSKFTITKVILDK